jgi:hypothetical protein
MFVTGKFDILVSCASVHHREHIAAPKRGHFLGGREASIVAEYTSDKACAKEHIGALQQHYAGSRLSGGDRRRRAAPSTSDNHDMLCVHFHHSRIYL